MQFLIWQLWLFLIVQHTRTWVAVFIIDRNPYILNAFTDPQSHLHPSVNEYVVINFIICCSSAFFWAANKFCNLNVQCCTNIFCSSAIPTSFFFWAVKRSSSIKSFFSASPVEASFTLFPICWLSFEEVTISRFFHFFSPSTIHLFWQISSNIRVPGVLDPFRVCRTNPEMWLLHFDRSNWI